MNEAHWSAILAARLHDPPEKALVLMRTREGHEAGTSRTLANLLFPEGLPKPARVAAERADHWASAADRAAFPNHDDDTRYPAWQQVDFAARPVVIHPLTGQSFELGKLTEIQPAHLQALSSAHLQALIQRDPDGRADLRRTALAFWRFGPEIDAEEIRSLWPLLPADTRVPDHTIFDHLDLTAAFAGSFASDPEGGPALLAVSIGPVQDFIASARSTSDLWAGSHLLSRMVWEAMCVVVEACGPEAVLFPRLRGVPQVDLWLATQAGLPRELFERERWTRDSSDSNPLFAAALPNRFTAMVPQRLAAELAGRIVERVRAFAHERARAAWREVVEGAGLADDPAAPAYEQIRRQLQGFPEVHWAAVPFSLAGVRPDGKVDPASSSLAQAMQPFFESSPPGYLGSVSWQLLSRSIRLEDGQFWWPNPGALYPALHELLERALSATKSTRSFVQTREEGWRCSLGGESEWLTTDRAQLQTYHRKQRDSVWARLAKARPAWARPGEHLGALATLKRLWPTLYVRELLEVAGLDIQRFVVSTHTLALAGSLLGSIACGRRLPEKFAQELGQSRASRVAMPHKLRAALQKHPDREALRLLPGWLEAQLDESGELQTEARRRLRRALDRDLENYYGLLLLDGDRMGAWVSPSDRSLTLPHEAHFHPQIRVALKRFRDDEAFVRYAREHRAASPSRHMAISEALNHFALRLAPAIVERSCAGRLIYAGGDDVLAMTTVDDLLPAMAGLRAAYSGIGGEHIGYAGDAQFELQADGFAVHGGRLCRLMGEKATASAGGVVAHHQAPLAAVLRELRDAEKRAKALPGKDAFSLSIVKRSGGALRLTTRWGMPLSLLLELRDFLRGPKVSRRAVYNATEWLRDVPEDARLISASIAWQFQRQGGEKAQCVHLGERMAAVALEPGNRPPGSTEIRWLCELMQCAEFLARESRGEVAQDEGSLA